MITTPAVLELRFRPHSHAKAASMRRLFTALFLTAGIAGEFVEQVDPATLDAVLRQFSGGRIGLGRH